MCDIFEHINLSDGEVKELETLIKPYLTEKRYFHSLCVMKEAERLGEIYLPDRINNLKAAALLHDITKIADFEKQLQYCRNFGIISVSDLTDSPEVLHAVTAKEVAKRDFPGYIDREILSAIKNHTTGCYGMSLFDMLIYLADYIEQSRQHESCISARKHFYDKIDAGEDPIAVLYDTMITIFDSTITYLLKNGTIINKDTVAARNYFIKLKATNLKREVIK